MREIERNGQSLGQLPESQRAALLRTVDDRIALGGAASALLAVVAVTPLADVWFESVSGLTPGMARFALWPVRIFMLLPALEYLLQSQRAFLILSRRTRSVTIGTGVEAVGISLTLAICVNWLDLPGAVAAAIALMTGRVAANVFLDRAMRT